jgi:feruloyl-CoA hydratase/lyase
MGTVVLNRPDQRNAMSPELNFEMEDAIDAVAADKDTKVLVLTGAGESWCAGQDIRLCSKEAIHI